MQAVIMAGGKGTRIASMAGDIPKPMIRLDEKPILEHQINCLKRQGILEIILVTGYLKDKIHTYFGDGKKFGIHLTYFDEKIPLGTAGALAYLKDILMEEFLLINGDLIFDLDFSRVIANHQSHSALATIVTHPNSHPYDSALVVTDVKGHVIEWCSKEEKREIYKNRVNAGIHILNRTLLSKIHRGSFVDLDKEILQPLIKEKQLYAYDTPEYIKDMGTPERYEEVSRDYFAGRIQAKNLERKQRAVFLDRDGTINVYKGFLTNSNEFELLPGVAEAIQTINQSGYLCIVITNQPVIARGECTLEELEEIHNKMETELGKKGAYLDAIYVCPHHPEKGFQGEREEYKIQCNCRKPGIELFLQAASTYHIDLSDSYMIGDSESDILAGKKAGTKTVYLSCHAENKYYADYKYSSLKEFIDHEWRK